MHMPITRREFVRGGVAAFTVGFAAPAFLSDLARAQGAVAAQPRRALSERRQRRAEHGDALHRRAVLRAPARRSRIPAANVLQIGSDSAGNALGLNPRLTGLRTIFNAGRLAMIQRTGYPNSSRSHFQGTDIWSTADPASPQGTGWLGRYLDTLPSPVDPLTGWSTVREIAADAAGADRSASPSIPNVRRLRVRQPERAARPTRSSRAQSATRIASHLPVDQPHLAFVNATAQAAFATLDRVAQVGTLRVRRSPIRTTASGRRCARSPARWSAGVGTQVFWVQTGGYDTHAGQNTEPGQRRLHRPDGDAERRRCSRSTTTCRTRACSTTRWCCSSRSSAAASPRTAASGTDHGAASVMMAMGGGVRGGIYGTAPNLRIAHGQPDAREQRQRRPLRDRLPLGLRERDRRVAGRPTPPPSWAPTSAAGAPAFL